MSVTMTQAPPEVPTGKDPLRELVERMDQLRLTIAAHDPKLNQQIEALAMNAGDRGRLDDPEFRTRVAYAYQDFTRLAGPAVGLPDKLRTEMEHLATTAPGLQNSRIHDMLREIPNLNNPGLAGDVRKLAFAVAREGGDQNRPDVLDRIEALERKLAVQGAGPLAGRQQPPEMAPQRAAEPVSPAAVQPPVTTVPKPEERVQAAMSPGEGIRAFPAGPPNSAASSTGAGGTRPHDGPTAPTPSTLQVPEPQPTRGQGVLARVMVAMADPRPDTSHPWNQPPTPIGGRIASFMGRLGEKSAVETAEASGQKAVEALRGFAQGAGAGIMARINEAARADPQGMQGVLSEMREGGRHADLRTHFNNALAQEKGLAASHEAAMSAVKQYGVDRQAAEAAILKRPDPGVLIGRFERLDAQIGEAAAQVPARQEGRSVVEELGQKVADLVRRATEAVRSAFQGAPRASASASPSPGP